MNLQESYFGHTAEDGNYFIQHQHPFSRGRHYFQSNPAFLSNHANPHFSDHFNQDKIFSPCNKKIPVNGQLHPPLNSPNNSIAEKVGNLIDSKQVDSNNNESTELNNNNLETSISSINISCNSKINSNNSFSKSFVSSRSMEHESISDKLASSEFNRGSPASHRSQAFDARNLRYSTPIQPNHFYHDNNLYYSNEYYSQFPYRYDSLCFPSSFQTSRFQSNSLSEKCVGINENISPVGHYLSNNYMSHHASMCEDQLHNSHYSELQMMKSCGNIKQSPLLNTSSMSEAVAAAVAAATSQRTGDMTGSDCDPRDLEAFAEHFKQRRIKLGATQADVGAALGKLKLPGVGSLSQSTICRFESLTLSHNNMVALKPVLQAWLGEAERQAREARLREEYMSGIGDGSFSDFADKKRKRTSIAGPEKRSLEAYFAIQPRPSGEKIAQIADRLDLRKNVVRVWFCNQRQKQKRMKFSASVLKSSR